ncbi:MAG: tail fiber protein [Proteobacteria bacterium]|nr:MAG: tail fiber protein [Pseudomonadota bacterium]
MIAVQQAQINDLQALLPVGTIVAFAGEAPPRDWLLCRGQVLDAKTYPVLFAVVGNKFGGGNTFSLPDLRNEFLRGASEARLVGTKEEFSTASTGLTAQTVLKDPIEVSTSGKYQSGWPTGHFSEQRFSASDTGASWNGRLMVGDENKNPYIFDMTSEGTANKGSWTTWKA